MMTARMKMRTRLIMTRMRPAPAAILLNLTWAGKAGSLIPVMGFFSRYGALAAN